jgi:hypothetical protein
LFTVARSTVTRTATSTYDGTTSTSGRACGSVEREMADSDHSVSACHNNYATGALR